MPDFSEDENEKKPSENLKAFPARGARPSSLYEDEDVNLPLKTQRPLRQPVSSLDPKPFFHVRQTRTRRTAKKFAFYSLLGLSCAFGILCGLMLVYSVDMPQMRDLERYRPNTTTELLDVKGRPFGSFALERRVVVPYSEFPPMLRQALFAIEDKNFESNAGISFVRVFGAAYRDLTTNGRKQGASTLTMQLARNLFLSLDQTWQRKLQEVLLTIQMERHFTKEQIFTLYANQIYLGSGAYGFEAGSQFYFSKHVHDLTLPEAALLAALPKGPEGYSPIRHPQRALKRRNLVLSEMLADKRITQAQYEQAKAAPLGLNLQQPENSIAPYFVEEVRRQLEDEFGSDQVHGAGLKIYTTMDLDMQVAANKAVLERLAEYERRHGWKGHLQHVEPGTDAYATYKHPDWTTPLEVGTYFHALLTDVSVKGLTVRIGKRDVHVAPETWIWTQMAKPDQFLKQGDVVYVRITKTGDAPQAALEQDSGAQGALMAMDNTTGEVLAMVGGRDFGVSQFNRATQAERQVGSSFKPYVYTAAIERGAKPTDIVLDVPTTFSTPSGPYTPHDYEAGYEGQMTLQTAFAHSRNIPALRLANQVGIKTVIDVAHRFGVTANIPAFLPVALGAASISLYEQTSSFSVFPNDGIRIEPHYIRRVVQADGLPLNVPTPEVKEVISVQTARTMMKLLEAVTQFGTGAQAGATLKHPLGGKTGTTNNYTDAWFMGFSPSVTCGVWVGYDDRKSLGDKETGARAALPIWMDVMKVAVARDANEQFPADNAPKRSLALQVNTASNAQEEKKKADTDDDDDTPAPPKKTMPVIKPIFPSTTPPDATPADSKPATAPAAPANQPAAPAPKPKAVPIVIQQTPQEKKPVGATPAVKPAPKSN